MATEVKTAEIKTPLTVSKSGSRSDDSFYAMVTKEDDMFSYIAFIKTKKLMAIGDEIKLPASVKIPWTVQ